MDYELARSNFTKLRSSLFIDVIDNKNEATTRLQLIDTMLIECLGWSREQIDAEIYQNGDYSDYELGNPQKRIIIEAKRESNYFQMPTGIDKLKYSLGTIYSLNDELANAINQVMRYCSKRGIPNAVVSNGHQYVLFISNRQDGVSPFDGNCIVFSSYKSIEQNFLLFWNCLSHEGILQNKIKQILGATSLIPPPEKLSKRILSYPGYKNRNPIAADLQILGGLFLEDIGRIPDSEEEFVKSTYCTSGALSQYALVSKEILNSRYTSFFEKETRVTTKSATNKHGVEQNLKDDLLTAGLSRRPILLVGDVGVGKSMFIKHLFLVDAKEELKDALIIYIDFGNKPTFASDLDEYVIDEITQQLLNKYTIDIMERNFIRGVYNREIERFAKGIYSDVKETDIEYFRLKELDYIASLVVNKENHLKSSIKHIVNGRKRQVVIFLDNVDQRKYEFQEKVFLISQSLAETWPVVAFVALRPDTFIRSKTSGTIAAYQPRVFTIDPPRVDKVITRRLEYGIEKLKQFGIPVREGSDFRLTSKTLEQYMEMLLRSFAESTEVVEFVDNMSNGNLRKAIELIGFFIGSAHVDSKKILHIIEEEGTYNLPIHEFIRAMIYKDNEHFNPDDSVVINAFDISNDNPKEHFLILILLSMIDKLGRITKNEGFVNTIDLFTNLQLIGYNEFEVEHSIFRLLDKSLIATTDYHEETIPSKVRILPAGAYTLLKLANKFTYIDSMIVDTPISLRDFNDKIHDVVSIEERIDRAGLFIEYLSKAWSDMDIEYFNWPEYKTQIQRELSNIQYAVRRNVSLKEGGA